jgi:succinate dehydrogenase / fumarate reductase, flavoprotein subunit
MGGIPVNTDGRVRSGIGDGLVDSFFSAGETACVSVHGANRLGSNSLLECIVYGKRTGAAIAQHVQTRKLPEIDEQHYLRLAEAQLQALVDQPGEYRINQVRQAFQDCMTDYCGVFRTEKLMREGLEKLQVIRQQAERVYLDDKAALWNSELVEALELQSLLTVGEVILTGALNRQESRGAHYREDFPDRNDTDFLKHTMAFYSPAGIDIQSRPVAITMFEPQERKY